MPSKSPAQARMMAAAAHDPAFAAKVGVPTTVAKEFNAADKGSEVLRRRRSAHRMQAQARMLRAGAR